MSSSAGYGICGHKNSFSSGVKLGNYVEDRIGGDLAQASRAAPLAGVTEAHANYIDPALMPDKSAHAPKENPTERFLLRSGLPYNLVFEHGKPHVPTSHELSAKYTLTSHTHGEFAQQIVPKLANVKSIQVEKRRAREVRERHSYTTTAQALLPVARKPHA